MTPALRQRLSSERLFTAEDMANAYGLGWQDGNVNVGHHADFYSATLTRVQNHLTSDTTTIRPRKDKP